MMMPRRTLMELVLMMRVMVVWRMVVVVGGSRVMGITRHGRCVHQHRGETRFRIDSDWFHHSVRLVLAVHPGIGMRMNVARSGKHRRFRQEGRKEPSSCHDYVI